MKQSPIIIIINKKPYTLYASDKESISHLPKTDRQQLITLLEAIKRLEAPVVSVAEPVAKRANSQAQTANTGNMSANLNVKSGDLSRGDADAIMAQLIVQEELNKKPELTKQTIHKWMAGSVIVVILLILIL